MVLSSCSGILLFSIVPSSLKSIRTGEFYYYLIFLVSVVLFSFCLTGDYLVWEVAAYLFKILGDGLHWVPISN